MAFDRKRYPYHVRHYRPAEFAPLLTNAGLDLQEKWSQPNRSSELIKRGWEGAYLIAVRKKPGKSDRHECRKNVA